MRALLDLNVQVYVDDQGRVHVTSSDPKLAGPVHFSPRSNSEAEISLRNAYRAELGLGVEVKREMGLRWEDVVHGDGPSNVLLFGSSYAVESGVKALRASYLAQNPEATVSTASSSAGIHRLESELAAEALDPILAEPRLVIVEVRGKIARSGNYMGSVLRLLPWCGGAGWSVLVVVRDEIDLASVAGSELLYELAHPVAGLLSTGFPAGTPADLVVPGIEWGGSDRWVYRGAPGETVVAW